MTGFHPKHRSSHFLTQGLCKKTTLCQIRSNFGLSIVNWFDKFIVNRTNWWNIFFITNELKTLWFDSVSNNPWRPHERFLHFGPYCTLSIGPHWYCQGRLADTMISCGHGLIFFAVGVILETATAGEIFVGVRYRWILPISVRFKIFLSLSQCQRWNIVKMGGYIPLIRQSSNSPPIIKPKQCVNLWGMLYLKALTCPSRHNKK